MLQIEEILGRSKKQAEKLGIKGCCFLGKSVSYPGGEYEEMGKTYLDIVSPHCMLVVGKRGTGKSYTLGVLAEGFGNLEKKHRDRVALVIVDTMSVFHSLKKGNTDQGETQRMKDFDIEPSSFEDIVRVMVPKIAVKEAEKDGYELFYDQLLKLKLSDVTVSEWLELFDVKLTEPTGILLQKVLTGLKDEDYSFDDIYTTIERISKDEKAVKALRGYFQMMEELRLFSKEGMDSQIAEGGKITVLDISYLGRIGNFELRNLIVSIFARKQMAQRTLYTTIEMQAQAGLVDSDTNEDITEEHPLIYMLIDEAHLFLPNNVETLATGPLIDWIKLGRHPGLSLILATQEPSAVHDSAIRQSDLIIAHNLTARDDVAALGMAKQSYMKNGLDKMVGQMEFRRGLALVFDDKTRRTQLCMVRPRHTLHTGIDASALTAEERC
ncbi:MAG: ATP-binding protein [Candidatus Saliniplasma sp.]